MSDTPETELEIFTATPDCEDLMETMDVVSADFARRLERERDEVRRFAAVWEESAAEFAKSVEFYRDIIVKIGEPFGVAAKTSDDGSIQQDVLALKVPELVDALREENRKLRKVAEEVKNHLYDKQDISRCRDLVNEILK